MKTQVCPSSAPACFIFVQFYPRVVYQSGFGIDLLVCHLLTIRMPLSFVGQICARKSVREGTLQLSVSAPLFLALSKSYQSGRSPYICTDCLKKQPDLALKVSETNVASRAITYSSHEDNLEASGVAKNIVDEILDIAEDFKCDQCDIRTKTKTQLETHKRLQHIDVGIFKCSLCEYVSNVQEKLTGHVRKHHEEKIKCRECTFVGKSQDEVNMHIWASRNNKVKCKECDFTANDSGTLSIHLKHHHSNNCQACEFKALSKDELDDHVRKTHVTKIFICIEWDFESSRREDVKEHASKEHGKANSENLDNIKGNFKILKENYERLVDINKNLQDQSKDKEYALDVQMSELKEGYEKAILENVKLKDNLDTQNKLWKMWLAKYSEEKDLNEVVEDKAKEVAADEKASMKDDDEILLIEENDDETNDETEMIFQHYL